MLISAGVEWTGLFQETNTSEPVPLANGTFPNTFWPMDIYRDVSTVVYDQTPPADNSTNGTSITNTTDPNYTPSYWFRVDNASSPHIGSLGLHTWDSFDTDISFGQLSGPSDILTQPLMAYPFDLWSGSITFVANFHAPGEADVVNTNTGNYTAPYVIALAGARLQDSSRN
jgi:hypothetical protein